MIKRIICYILFVLLILALILKLNGVNELSLFNPGYRSFINRLAYSFNEYQSIQIGSIRTLASQYSVDSGILQVLISIADAIISFINAIINFFNIMIQLFLFMWSFVEAIFSFGSYVTA